MCPLFQGLNVFYNSYIQRHLLLLLSKNPKKTFQMFFKTFIYATTLILDNLHEKPSHLKTKRSSINP